MAGVRFDRFGHVGFVFTAPFLSPVFTQIEVRSDARMCVSVVSESL